MTLGRTRFRHIGTLITSFRLWIQLISSLDPILDSTTEPNLIYKPRLTLRYKESLHVYYDKRTSQNTVFLVKTQPQTTPHADPIPPP